MTTRRDSAHKVTHTVDRITTAWGAEVLRWVAALLWLGNVSWKRPPDFGRTAKGCAALCKYTKAGIDHPVVPGAPWLFEHIISPHLWAFGWLTILIEGALVVLLVSGRYRRTAAVIGIIQSFAIMSAVANAPGEWYWSYLLMIALHLALLITAPSAHMPSASTTAVVTIGFGALMALVHSGEGPTGTAFTLFSGRSDLPDDLGRNLFGGSVLLGVIIIAVGVVGLLLVRLRLDQQRIAGMVIGAIGIILAFTYGPHGLLLRLGSTTTTACFIVALGLALAVQNTGNVLADRRESDGPDEEAMAAPGTPDVATDSPSTQA